jgi:hypothetical protein
MKESYKDIRKLLEQFMTARDAGQMTEDIRQADSLLSSVPAVRASEETLDAIRDKVHRCLAARQTRTVHIRIERYFAAVAALVLIAALAFVFFKINLPAKQIGALPSLAVTMIWDDNLAADTELTNQFDQLTGQMDKVNQVATQWLNENSSLTVEVEDIEQIALNTDFWKG